MWFARADIRKPDRNLGLRNVRELSAGGRARRIIIFPISIFDGLGSENLRAGLD